MATFRNPVLTDDRGIDRGDPFVLGYRGRYYLFHTSENPGLGILVHSSTDLVNWEEHGHALQPSTDPDHWAQADLWAPEVMYEDGMFYMYVTGTRVEEDGTPSEAHRRQGLARSEDPLGPYDLDDRPLIEDEWTIDGHPLRDQDGTTWLVYNIRERIWDPATRSSYLARQTGNVIDQLVAPDQLAGRPSVVSFPTEAWEGNGHFFWNEGAWVLKRGGRYHLLYSGCDYRDRGYAVGLLTATNPRGPWIKHPDNPILRSGDRIVGPGHPSVALAPDGISQYIVYHAYIDRPGEGRKVHLDRVHWAGDVPVIGEPAGTPTETPQRMPPRPVQDPEVATWVADAWVQGAWCEISGVRLELQSAAWHRINARNGVSSLCVWIDDRLVHEGGPVGPCELTSEGQVEALAVTSCLEDDGEHVLKTGESKEWPWPGHERVELTMAVRGACVVHLGTAQVQVERSLDRWGLFRMVGVPAGRLRVRALTGGAAVRDLLVIARESVYLDDHLESLEPGGTVVASNSNHDSALPPVPWTWVEERSPA